jgi:hypothetical protein
MKILKAVVPKEEIIEPGDDKETMVARLEDKDGCGRESDSSDTVLIYSYGTHYI